MCPYAIGFVLSHLGDIDMKSILWLSRADVAPFFEGLLYIHTQNWCDALFLGVGDGKGHAFNNKDLDIDVRK